QKFNPDFPYEEKIDTAGPSLNGLLPIGFSYDFRTFAREDNARTDFSGDRGDAMFFPGGIRQTNNYYASVALTMQQHLLRDFWIDAEREQILIRRKDVKISQQALGFQIMKTVLAVELAYYDLVAARENVRVQEKALELRQQLVSETKRRVQV